MKKITIITMQLKNPGGIERFVSTLATIFSSDFKVEVVVNYGKPTDQLAFPIPNNIKLTFLLPNHPKIISMKKILFKLQWHKIIPELNRRRQITTDRNKAFQSYFRNHKTDFIITERALYNNLINRYYLGNAKKIATDHNFHQNNPKYIHTLLHSLRGFDSLVVATDELKKFYQAKISPTKCYFIPNPLPNIPQKKSTLNNKNLLAIGRLVPEKDFSLLIETMKYIHKQDPNITLTIIGDGSENNILRSRIKKLRLENCITMPGWLSQSQITNYYYNSSLYVMTSRTEAFGLVLAEAMSYGLPCIALSRASGARAQISKKTGVLISKPDPKIIANQILSLLSHPTTLKNYQKNLEKNIKNYSPSSVKNAWLKILHS